MRSAEEAKGPVVETLQPERQAIHAGASEIGEARRLYRIRIGLKRDLDIARRGPVRGCRGDDRFGRCRLHQRRRASAEEDRSELSPGKQPRLMRQVGKQRFAPRLLVDVSTNMAVEVAIGT